MNGRSALLEPALVAQLGSLELQARAALAGLAGGGHPGIRAGAGTEFVGHRAYRVGDDLRHLDWKLLARSDRMHVRTYREASDLPLLLALDASPSMGIPAAEPGITPLRFAAILAAALGFVSLRGGDRPGLLLSSGTHLPCRSGRRHLARLLGVLERVEPAGVGLDPAVLEERACRIGRRGGLVVVSDLLSGEGELLRALATIAARGHQVHLVHLLPPVETFLPPGAGGFYEDVESGVRLEADPARIRDQVRSGLASLASEVRSRALRARIHLHPTSPLDPPARVLRTLCGRDRRGAPVNRGPWGEKGAA